MAHREVELKLEVAPAEMGRLRSALGTDSGLAQVSASERLESVYFDTDRLDLRRAGLLLRVRRQGKRHIQTIKRTNWAAAGIFDRPEWEQDVKGERPDIAAIRKLDLGHAVTRIIAEAAHPVFQTVVTRTSYRMNHDDADIALAVDEGHVAAGRHRAPVSEVELELERGDPAQLFDLARRFQKIVPLRLGIRSKADRGFALLENHEPRPVKSGSIELGRKFTTQQAFQTVATDCLRQLAANEAVLQSGDFEAVHQMRVALRRLRAAMSVFSPIVRDSRSEHIKSELKWITGELAPARELDVFFAEVAAKREGQPGNGEDIRSGTDSFRAELDRRRQDALERAKRATNAIRFRELLLDTVEWIKTGPWIADRAKRRRKLADTAVATYSAGELARRRRKIDKRGRKLAKLDRRRRHKLRIAVKKFRYATDFFAALFPGKKAKRHRKDLTGVLKEMQDALGELNDMAAHEVIAFDVARGGGNGGQASSDLKNESRAPLRSGNRRAFAAGLTVGAEMAHSENCLRRAKRAHRRFERIKPFWT